MLRCSFCSKTEEQVAKLVAGPGGVYICYECVAVASRLMQESRPNFLKRLWIRFTASKIVRFDNLPAR